jgi:predicted ATPase/DNA-binding CsgD family transcriptional regulator
MHEMHSLPQSNLPTPLTPLVGREQEIAAVWALLLRPEVRLVTLTGTGGVGKTRLALEVAAAARSDFADGVCFVALASLSDSGLVVSTIAGALGVREQASQPLLESLKDSLREKQLLLVLDNFEQILSAAPVVVALLLVAPAVKVVVTSRAPLHLSGEHEVVVPPLPLPDLRDLPPLDRLAQAEAIRLFVERAQAVKSDFALSKENAAAIVAICHQVDGLPLAIELAAGRVKLLPPQALLPRLKDRLGLLVGGARDLPARQQTLRATITWSYDLLDQHEQALFRRLAVFVGGCTLQAAEIVCHTNGDLERDILDEGARLVDNNLLQQEAQADGEPRVLMLETIREYALACLNTSGETEAMQRRHANFFLQQALEADRKVRSGEQAIWYRRLEVEHDNLRAALSFTLEYQEAEMGLRLAGALWAFWRRHLREGRTWFEQVLTQPGSQARTAARAWALLGAGALALFQGDFLEAGRLLEESVAIGREVGAAGKRNLAHALMMLGYMVLAQGNVNAACELAEESQRLFQEVGEAWGLAMGLSLLGEATVKRGDPVAARALLEESVALFRVAGDRQRLVLPIDALGLVALQQGDYAGARARFEEALVLAREAEDEPFIADVLAHLGTVSFQEGDAQQSAELYQQSLALNRVLGNRDGIAENLAGLAEVAVLSGQPERAAQLLGTVEAVHLTHQIELVPLRRAEYDRLVEGIRIHLGDVAFALAWARGRAMELSQAIAFALETKDAEPAGSQASEKAALPDPLSLLPAPPLSPRRALQQQFGGLTAREREVARLVARGKSNRAIADELVVGVSTVEAHITHIFTKLGFSSRAQIAAWAVDKGLAMVPQDMEGTRHKH